ncbi:MAG: YraN family protein [Bacillota bacterium]
MTVSRQLLGKWGEEKAIKYLKSRKYIILDTNFSIRNGEIDIIAKKANYLVFIEVKTSKSNKFGTPQASVNFIKQQKIKKVARFYIFSNDINNIKIRFDVIAIKIFKGKGCLKHFKNAFF